MGNLRERERTRLRRKKQIRKKVFGTLERPRLSVFKSAKHIYAQVVDDSSGKTLAAASTLESAFKEQFAGNKKLEASVLVGKLIAKKCLEKDINTVIFDRNGFIYHGRVAKLADGAREGGLKF